MFKKGFKFYMGMYAAAACITGVIILIFRFCTGAFDAVVDGYVNLATKIGERFVGEKD